MMGRSLLVLGWLATGGLAASAALGYTTHDQVSLERHLLVSLLATLMLLFSHCWILFYLIGTGKAVRVAVEENGLDPSLVAETRLFKRKSNPPLCLAMALAMATFVAGAPAFAGGSPLVHHVLFWITLWAQVYALVVEGRVLVANERLMNGVERQLVQAEGAVS